MAMARFRWIITTNLLYVGLWAWDNASVNIFATAAAAGVPSGSPSSFWKVGNDISFRRNDDIPIMGDHSAEWKKPQMSSGGDKPRSRGSKRRKRRRREDKVDGDAYDTSDDDDVPTPFFLDQNYDQDYENKRHRRRQQHQQRNHRNNHRNNHQPLDSIRQWTLEKTGVQIPRINLHFDPVTVLKIRKSWHNILPWAIIRVGADFETHRLGKGLWRLRGCVEDKLIGGRFTIKEKRIGDERAVLMEYSKSWLFSSGAGSSIGTRFNLGAVYDLTTYRGSVRFGFRAENTDATIGTYQLMPGRKGFTIVPIIPLDVDRRLLLEAKTNIEIPEPEFVIGTDFDGMSADSSSVSMGMGGDVDVEIEEVNLIFSL